MKIEVWLVVVCALALAGVGLCFAAFLPCWSFGASVSLFDLGLASLACAVPAMVGVKYSKN